MKTVAQLKSEGFIVQPSKEAVGCTEVMHSAPFWFYNPRFFSEPAHVAERLEAANSVIENGTQSYRLLVAGSYFDADGFPFAILQASGKAAIDASLRCIQEAEELRDKSQAMLDEAKQSFFEALSVAA